MEVRVYGKPISISNESVKSFYVDRVARYDPKNPLLSVMCQDNDPLLAEARDKHEKSIITPLLDLKNEDSILDVGCGIGRWAENTAHNVSHYHGVDAMEGLIKIAKERFINNVNMSFQALVAQDICKEKLTYKSNFNLIIIAGVLMYINDDDCKQILTQIIDCCEKNSRILITCPIGVKERLTLNQIWSEELKCKYSAIYRTVAEYITLFSETIGKRGFKLIISQQLFPNHLNNRKETEQYFFILQRQI